MLLSAFSPAELAVFVRDENVAMIKSVKGIGPKAAQRIILDLKDKMPLDMAVDGSGAMSASAEVVAPPEVVKEAVAALTMWGFAPAPTQKVVLKIVKDDAALPVEQIIKQALKML
jgi:Holliday junction DNA helicase RuvA